jgi:alpha-tubulin suppressor-like RCC1 family protein
MDGDMSAPRWSFVLLIAACLAGGCESRVSIGARCTADAECGSLQCEYGRCRAACVLDADCGGALVCNQGVCAEPSESCTVGSGCLLATLACADTICAPRCDTTPCPSDEACVARDGALVCVPEARADAGAMDAEAMDAGPMDAAPMDASPERDAGPSQDAGVVEPARDHGLCVGPGHVCAIRPDGRVYCWGANENGLLGDATSTSAPRPFTAPGPCGALDCSPRPERAVQRLRMGRVGPLEGVQSLACGDGFVCASDATSTYCWGHPGDGHQLGFPGGTVSYAAQASALEGVRPAAGDHHVCVTGASGEPACWGENRVGAEAIDGRLGHTMPATSMVTDAPRFAGAIELTARTGFTCMRTREAVECAGYSLRWLTGRAFEGPDPTGGRIEGIVGIPSDVAAMSVHACAIAEGTAYCWGWDTSGNLGRGADGVFDDCSTSRCAAVAAPITFTADPDLVGLRLTRLSRGDASNTCAIEGERGRVVCWGSNQHGQSGVDPSLFPRVHSVVGFVRREDDSELEGMVELACGGTTCCARDEGRDVYCWGHNGVGQLGRGTVDTVGAGDAGGLDGGMPVTLEHPEASAVDFTRTGS